MRFLFDTLNIFLLTSIMLMLWYSYAPFYTHGCKSLCQDELQSFCHKVMEHAEIT